MTATHTAAPALPARTRLLWALFAAALALYAFTPRSTTTLRSDDFSPVPSLQSAPGFVESDDRIELSAPAGRSVHRPSPDSGISGVDEILFAPLGALLIAALIGVCVYCWPRGSRRVLLPVAAAAGAGMLLNSLGAFVGVRFGLLPVLAAMLAGLFGTIHVRRTRTVSLSWVPRSAA